ncbi:hypothetical protein D9M70_549000 [compost metagenome]
MAHACFAGDEAGAEHVQGLAGGQRLDEQLDGHALGTDHPPEAGDAALRSLHGGALLHSNASGFQALQDDVQRCLVAQLPADGGEVFCAATLDDDAALVMVHAKGQAVLAGMLQMEADAVLQKGLPAIEVIRLDHGVAHAAGTEDILFHDETPQWFKPACGRSGSRS